MVTVGNARHLGMVTFHAMKALDRDMIGVFMTSTRGAVPANNELPLYSMLQPVKPHNSLQSIGTRQTGDKASSKPAFNQTAGGLTPFQANWF